MKNIWYIRGVISRVIFSARTLSATVLILILAHAGLAQRGEEPRSFSLGDKSQDQIDRKILPKIDIERLLAEDRARGRSPERPGPDRFAVAARTAFTLKNAGTSQDVGEGRIWRLRIQSPGARSINLGITRFELPEGARLWIYDPGRKNVAGPYTSRDRSHQGSLWTPPIPGDEIVIEVFVPKGAREPLINIGAVNQAYRDFSKDGGDKNHGACNNDVICPEGDPWRDQIRSVARYTINGTSLCTGQLMNSTGNTPGNFTPYFLSANHCGVTSANDDTLVFFWNFQAPNCGDQDGGSLADSQTGAIFRASSAPSDFLLVELEEDPSAFNVFYSGWDVSGNAAASTVGIHHPRGDVKSISFNTNAVTSTAYLSDTTNAGANHWRIDDWEDGTTEGGSSGSCLWDAATKRCIGQLHGGDALCTAQNESDWYGKLSVSWTGGGTDATRLSNWLDSAGTGTQGIDGDPHITTANGVNYDFQGAGEFVALRDPGGLEIQMRMTPISTTFTPGADPYHGLATCVSINTAVAARVGGHRVTIQPNISGVPDPSGLQVRVDGNLTAVGAGGVDLGFGARIDKTGDSFRITFPNGTLFIVNALFWGDQGKWYLNTEIVRSASDGLSGSGPGGSSIIGGGLTDSIAPGSWLPGLSNGTSMGPMPGTLHQRYVDLYEKFGESWRVTDASSLFDYARGTSTKTFTNRNWPGENLSCNIPGSPTVRPIPIAVARRLCREVADKNTNAHCVFDVVNTGEPGFAKLYLTKQQIRNGFTNTAVNVGKDPVSIRERVTFTATVRRRAVGRGIPTGTVQFMLDGRLIGEPVRLDKTGRATFTSSDLRAGKHQLLARYTPSEGSAFIASSGREKVFTVTEK